MQYDNKHREFMPTMHNLFDYILLKLNNLYLLNNIVARIIACI